ncbi:MAG: hypothetical protein GEV03_11685 [Streptosporangiales bacterium]|nr:hypothetical protein [Streptosporangiales bacterium]
MDDAEMPGFEPIMRDGLPPDQAPGKPLLLGPEYDVRRENGLLIERNVAVPLRDEVRILVDIYRPDGGGDRDHHPDSGGLPVILGWSPYGKHNLRDKLPWPAAGVQDGWLSPYTAFEAPDPAYWCRHGYVVVYADPRGTWLSEGEMHHGGPGARGARPGRDRDLAFEHVVPARPSAPSGGEGARHLRPDGAEATPLPSRGHPQRRGTHHPRRRRVRLLPARSGGSPAVAGGRGRNRRPRE